MGQCWLSQGWNQGAFQGWVIIWWFNQERIYISILLEKGNGRIHIFMGVGILAVCSLNPPMQRRNWDEEESKTESCMMQSHRGPTFAIVFWLEVSHRYFSQWRETDYMKAWKQKTGNMRAFEVCPLHHWISYSAK